MPWIKDAMFHPEEFQRFSEPARIQLALCGTLIYHNATRKDATVEEWLAKVKLHLAG